MSANSKTPNVQQTATFPHANRCWLVSVLARIFERFSGALRGIASARAPRPEIKFSAAFDAHHLGAFEHLRLEYPKLSGMLLTSTSQAYSEIMSVSMF